MTLRRRRRQPKSLPPFRVSGVCFAYPATREDVNYAQMTESDWILNRIYCIETLDVGYQIRNCGGSRLEEFAG